MRAWALVKNTRSGLQTPKRRRIDDLVEMRAEPRLVAQVGDAMVLLVGGGEAAAAGALPPGVGQRQHLAVDDGVLGEPVGHELLQPVGHALGFQPAVQGDVEVEPAAQHLQEIAAEEIARHLVMVEAPVGLQAGVPGRGRARLGERDDAVDVEDEDRAGTHGRPCYSSRRLPRIVRCSSLSPPWRISTPTPTRSGAAGRRTISSRRRPRWRSWSTSTPIQRPSWPCSTTARPRPVPSPCPTARRWRACRAIGAGYGMTASAARSTCAGSPARRRCRRLASAISATPWCRGSAAAATPPALWRCCCRRRARRGSPMSS